MPSFQSSNDRNIALEALKAQLGPELEKRIKSTREALEQLRDTELVGDEALRQVVNLSKELDHLTDTQDALNGKISTGTTDLNQYMQAVQFGASRIENLTGSLKGTVLQLADYNQQFTTFAQKMRDFRGRSDEQIRSLDSLRKTLKLTNGEYLDLAKTLEGLAPTASIESLDKVGEALVRIRGQIQGVKDLKELIGAEGNSPGLLAAVQSSQRGDQSQLLNQITSGGLTQEQREIAVTAGSRGVGDAKGTDTKAADIRMQAEQTQTGMLQTLQSTLGIEGESLEALTVMSSTITSGFAEFTNLMALQQIFAERTAGKIDHQLSDVVTKLEAIKDFASKAQTVTGTQVSSPRGPGQIDLDQEMRDLSSGRKDRPRRTGLGGRMKGYLGKAGRTLLSGAKSLGPKLFRGGISGGVGLGVHFLTPMISNYLAKNFGSTAGAAATVGGATLKGAATGAALGTFVPGGTVVGAAVGAGYGALTSIPWNEVASTLGSLVGLDYAAEGIKSADQQFQEFAQKDPLAALVNTMSEFDSTQARLQKNLDNLANGIDAKVAELALQEGKDSALAGRSTVGETSKIVEAQRRKADKLSDSTAVMDLASGDEKLNRLKKLQGDRQGDVYRLEQEGRTEDDPELVQARRNLDMADRSVEEGTRTREVALGKYNEAVKSILNTSAALEEVDQANQEQFGYIKDRMKIAIEETAAYDSLAGDYSKIVEASEKANDLLQKQREIAAARIKDEEGSVDTMREFLATQEEQKKNVENRLAAEKDIQERERLELELKTRSSTIDETRKTLAEREVALTKLRAAKKSEILQAELDNLKFQQEALDAASSLNKVLNSRAFKETGFRQGILQNEQSQLGAQQGVAQAQLSRASKFGSADDVGNQYQAITQITDQLIQNSRQQLSEAQTQANAVEGKLQEEAARVRELQAKAKSSGSASDAKSAELAEESYLNQLKKKTELLNQAKSAEQELISIETERRDLEIRRAKDTFAKRTMQLDAEKFQLEQQKDLAEFVGASYPEIARIEQQNLSNMKRRLAEVNALVGDLGASIPEDERAFNEEYQGALRQQLQLQNEIKKTEVGVQRNFLDKALGAMYGVVSGSKAQPLLNNRDIAGGRAYMVGARGEIIGQDRGLPRSPEQRRAEMVQSVTQQDAGAAFADAKDVANASRDAFAAIKSLSDKGIALSVSVEGIGELTSLKARVAKIESEFPVQIRNEVNRFATKPA